MNFESGYIYHIYNQGNNHRPIFFNRENYLFFLQKVKANLLPYCDVLAWCLMPNHFHFMVIIREIDLPLVEESELGVKTRSLNDSIAIMLRSYTRAINKQFGFSGSLFREETKAECVNCPNGITPSFITKSGITYFNIANPEKQYPQVCFNYIHQNPVKAKLVNNAVDWEFCSAPDYAGLRNGKLVNKTVAGKYFDF